jgi:hypothetical protein
MDASKIASHLIRDVPTFRDVQVIGPGIAYHYTVHADAIEKSGRFLGAPLDATLDQTQNPNAPNIATAEPGVVFAYEVLAEAAEEGDSAGWLYGREAEVFEVHYSAAVRAVHSQEADGTEAPPTILISSAQIQRFTRLGLCSQHFRE